MSEENYKVAMGEIINFSYGEYSDYSYCGNVVFLKDCDLVEVKNLYKKFIIESKGYPDTSGFVTWMVSKEYCVQISCREIHLGSYGTIIDEDCYGWSE